VKWDRLGLLVLRATKDQLECLDQKGHKEWREEAGLLGQLGNLVKKEKLVFPAFLDQQGETDCQASEACPECLAHRETPGRMGSRGRWGHQAPRVTRAAREILDPREDLAPEDREERWDQLALLERRAPRVSWGDVEQREKMVHWVSMGPLEFREPKDLLVSQVEREK